MTSIRRVLAAAIAAGLALAGVSTAPSGAAETGAQAKTTVVTVAIGSCEGCEVMLISYTAEDPENGWASDPHTIANGKAAFVVPTDKTLGLSVAVDTPWEGQGTPAP